MPLQKLQFRPGVNRESTTLANEGGWFESDKVRFRSGYPEKIGGWVVDTGVETPTTPIGTFTSGGTTASAIPTTGTFWGTCRALWNWLNLAAYNLLAVGTNLKYYVQNGVNGSFYDITPIRLTRATVSNAFTTDTATNIGGKTTLVVNDPGHGSQTGDFVSISATSGAVNGVPAANINGERQITYISTNTYSVVVTGTATSSGTSAVTATFTYQINSGNEIFTQNVGWGAGTWGGVVIGTPTTAVAGGTLSNSNTTVTVTSTTGFSTPTGTLLIDSETITYTGTTSTTFTGCTRGVDGTPGSGAATTHADGAAVVQSTSFTGWGEASASAGVGQQLRLWSQANFGQDLIFAPRGGPMYYWANNATPTTFDRAQLLGPSVAVTTSTGSFTPDTSCPSVVNFVTISDASRFVLAFGVNDYPGTASANTQDPMLIRWSDQERPDIWAPAVTNQAGSYRLSHGSQIVTAMQTRQEILVYTDSAIYSMQYLGPPYVWGFQLMGDNISMTGPNAVTTVNNITYWMGTDKFYMYSGRVETLPCALRQYVFDDINLVQGYQFFASTNEGYNEIWWFYCSITGTDGTGTLANPNEKVDRYIIFNHLERTWYYGKMERSCWLDSPLRQVPMSAGYKNSNGTLIYQETGNDDGATTPGTLLPIEAYVQSSDFDIGDGHNFGLVTRVIPDVTFDGSTVNNPSLDFSVRPRQFPGTNYGSTDSPTVTSAQNYTSVPTYTVQEFTQQVYVRVRGRQMAFRISSNDLGVAWQLGSPRIDVRPDGRR
jgi:hypothetical protein